MPPVQEPAHFQAVASPTALAALPLLITNKILFGLADCTLTLAVAVGPNVAASDCTRSLSAEKGMQGRLQHIATLQPPMGPLPPTCLAQGHSEMCCRQQPRCQRSRPDSRSYISKGKRSVQECNHFTSKISQMTGLLKGNTRLTAHLCVKEK